MLITYQVTNEADLLVGASAVDGTCHSICESSRCATFLFAITEDTSLLY